MEEKQKLPNSTLILVLGILSIIGCCCYGILGIALGIVAMVLAKRATEQYNANPDMYDGFQNVKTGRILAIIGIVLGVISLIATIAMIMMYGGIEGMQEMQEEMMREYGG